VTRQDVVLGSRISGKRERKSWKREEKEAEEPWCRSLELAHTGCFPSRPCLRLARPTHGSCQTRFGGKGALVFFLGADLLFLSHFNFLQLVMCQDEIGGCDGLDLRGFLLCNTLKVYGRNKKKEDL
jgi:hypothetical protein